MNRRRKVEGSNEVITRKAGREEGKEGGSMETAEMKKMKGKNEKLEEMISEWQEEEK